MDVNELNRRAYKRGGNLVCTRCLFEIDIEGSYSNQGKDAICGNCLKKAADEEDMSPSEYLENYIWESESDTDRIYNEVMMEEG